MVSEPDLGFRTYRIAGVLTARFPDGDAVPVLFDSPHSGRTIPDDFVTRVSLAELRTGEDAFVDELVSGCLARGIGLVAAEFPRAYIDANRPIDDIDESMLDAPWPGGAVPTDKSARGMGLIRREILKGVPLYDAPLSVAEVDRRIENYYRPYHAAVREGLDRLHAVYRRVWHVDWHSMKPVGVAMNVDAGEARPDFVVSDGEGRTAAPDLTESVAGWLRERGYSASVNDPYKGAEMIRRYGAPEEGRHSIQIEINRRLYLDAERMVRTNGFAALKRDLDAFAAWLADCVRERAG